MCFVLLRSIPLEYEDQSQYGAGMESYGSAAMAVLQKFPLSVSDQ